MNLEEFAKLSGVSLTSCDASWGGRIAYKTSDASNCSCCGFRTEGAAYKHWLSSTFGEAASKAILRLLKQSEAISRATGGK